MNSPSPMRAMLRAALEELLRALDSQPAQLQLPPRLSRTHQRLIAAASAVPQPAKVLSKRAGLKFGGTIRQILADLVRAGLLIHGPDGYSLPG